MGVRITQCAIATGHLEGSDFGPSLHEGDWRTFSGDLTTFTSAGEKEPIFDRPPCVIVTPSLEDEKDFGAFPVCVFLNPASERDSGIALVQIEAREAIVLLTATDQGVTGYSIPAVGALFDAGIGGTLLSAYNPDLVSGGCAFNYVGFPSLQRFGRVAGEVAPAIRPSTAVCAA